MCQNSIHDTLATENVEKRLHLPKRIPVEFHDEPLSSAESREYLASRKLRGLTIEVLVRAENF